MFTLLEMIFAVVLTASVCFWAGMKWAMVDLKWAALERRKYTKITSCLMNGEI